ncbi:hypothetical protein [Ferrimonas aestuarii]|uniref:Uncharacterized protein n=1 Tax=Ferrimonas aestuarii TaxID=2569539 RepID=A0A4U1BL90_9GAMM|nr:hypothetical protein [Ferrimonas aestuarii]TKB53288.1 hypothetical protein FCL42_14545 [Ferrimonas aestuarii]
MTELLGGFDVDHTKPAPLPGKPCSTGAPNNPSLWVAKQTIACREGSTTPEAVKEQIATFPPYVQTAIAKAKPHINAQIKQQGYDKWAEFHKKHFEESEQCS